MALEINSAIDIVLPVYNGENTIKKAIFSILEQSHTNFILWVINDGSTDRTLAVLSAISDSRIRVLSIPKKGIAAALNFGIAQGNHPILARMDADDVALPKRLALQLQYLVDHPTISACATHTIYKNKTNENTAGFARFVDWQNSIETSKGVYLNRFIDAPIAHPTLLFKRALITKYGDYTLQGPEDYELWLRWMHHGEKIGVVNKPLLEWNDYPERATRILPQYKKEAFYDIKALYFKSWFVSFFSKKQPKIWICGTGNKVKSKTRTLLSLALPIEGFVDINRATNFLGYPSISYSELTAQSNVFILVYVATPSAKIKISEFLKSNSYLEGIHYYFMT